ncbi:MAG: hypothetical protein COV29_04290 [Candidatus Yanofskybacteria bacterium CG10_big_fil_rev_8_21_14_0_10_36_16]|uniref:Uncharacterized protein n=1 Tax=Candidatus Yanofskybacteria bacterium CG10_big_fil_rev_8_21_14_0_10_36_16 TaxID=1975096 RepID=A0A2J0Q6Q9_9BACT|nr:MAG: hypothetical protein COV29_04290 [Candidatus Yanofskybacteria bacterium CG10_big_fil_rev_8_21_14_0_10_36_16]
MHKKDKEKTRARQLRSRGGSIKEIARKLSVSQSSVSTWVRDINLTQNQINFLKHKGHLKEVIKKRIQTRLKNEKNKRRNIINNHKTLFPNYKTTNDNLLIIGTVLYWAEGTKSDKSRMFKFSNSDPHMIKIMINFLKKICRIPKNRLRGHIHLHPHLNNKVAEKYWSKVSKIPLDQFYKTSQSLNKRSKNIKDKLPYGTFNIEICSVDLYLKMLAWIEALKEKTLQET